MTPSVDNPLADARGSKNTALIASAFNDASIERFATAAGNAIHAAQVSPPDVGVARPGAADRVGNR
jgi:hypothetical protein